MSDSRGEVSVHVASVMVVVSNSSSAMMILHIHYGSHSCHTTPGVPSLSGHAEISRSAERTERPTDDLLDIAWSEIGVSRRQRVGLAALFATRDLSACDVRVLLHQAQAHQRHDQNRVVKIPTNQSLSERKSIRYKYNNR